MNLILFGLLGIHAEKLKYAEHEYVKCECSTKVTTNSTTMSIEFGGEDQCVYKSESDIEEVTDPFRIIETDENNNKKLYCKVLAGSCFNVRYYRIPSPELRTDEMNKRCFSNGEESNVITNTSCSEVAFHFKGCAVNEKRRCIEYEIYSI